MYTDTEPEERQQLFDPAAISAEAAKDKPKKRPFGLKLKKHTSDHTATSDKSSSSGLKRTAQFLRKYWYVVIILLVLVGGLIAWRSYQLHLDAQWSKAQDYYGRADYANAAKILEPMALPTDDKRLTVYAQTMLATRKLDKALPAYQTLYSHKKDPDVKIKIGNIYNEQKKYDEAAKAYREIITADSSYIQAYVNLATLYKLQGKSQEAIDTAKQGTQANPNSVVLYELLISMTLEHKDSQEHKDAVEALKKLNPQDPIFEVLQ